MKKSIYRILPFILMFVVVMGSVVLSCNTLPGTKHGRGDNVISLNTGNNEEGRIFTTWVLREIKSIMVIDFSDPSRKIELTSDDWSYNSDTTEITISKEIPFADYIVHVEGINTIPHEFVFNDMKPESDLLVIFDGRLAIEGFDYSLDKPGAKLIFREDINLNKYSWLIQYATHFGLTSLGDWKPENADRMSYLEAEHRKRALDSWYDRQETFWFFDGPTNSDQLPGLVKRKPTEKELADFKSYSPAVMKFHTETPEAKLSLELGFDSSLPKLVFTDTPTGKFTLTGKIVEEASLSGTLTRDLLALYNIGNSESAGRILELVLSVENKHGTINADSEWIIREDTIDLGLPVQIVHQWGIQITDLDKKPEIIGLCLWTWTDGSVHFSVSANSTDEKLLNSFIRQIIAFRQK